MTALQLVLLSVLLGTVMTTAAVTAVILIAKYIFHYDLTKGAKPGRIARRGFEMVILCGFLRYISLRGYIWPQLAPLFNIGLLIGWGIIFFALFRFIGSKLFRK